MPFYSDQMFYARPLVLAIVGGVGSLVGTGTNIGVAYPAAGVAPTFIRRTAITNVQVSCVTAPVAGATGGVLSLLNGTNTFATCTYSGGTANATAGALATVTLNTANNTFAAGGAVTGTLIGTVTSGGTGAGAFSIWFEQQELYA